MGLPSAASLRRAAARASRSPLAWILAAVFVLRVVGIGWGLPASDGWDNDGVAPRDFLAGLVETVIPGHYYTYPPVHLVLLAFVTAPVAIVALAHARSLQPADVIHEFLKVPYMTTFAVAARLVSVALSLGIVWAIAKVTEELRGERAGWCAAAFVGVNVPLTYYAHTTNLDVPYLFWGCLAVLVLVRAVGRREPRLLRRWAVLAALAVGTKDQAYALFLLAAPAGLALWLALDPWARQRARVVLREAALATGTGLGVLVIADAVLVNPTGFLARVRFLLGPASQDYAQYTNDWRGRWDVVHDLVTRFDLYYPAGFAILVALGLALVVRAARGRPARLVAALLPLLVVLSFTACFNCIARRTDHRFGLPQMVLVAVYGGIGLEALVFGLRFAPVRWLARLVAAAAFAVALFGAADVDANLLLDPRYDAEAWMRAHVSPGDTIETYGLNVYMPRFPPGAHVIRAGPYPSEHRNPMPGVEEVVADYDHAAARGAKYIVVSQGWAWRYLVDPSDWPNDGHMLAPTEQVSSRDREATAYFRALTSGRCDGYELVHVSTWTSKVWPPIDLHASTARDIWIYARSH